MNTAFINMNKLNMDWIIDQLHKSTGDSVDEIKSKGIPVDINIEGDLYNELSVWITYYYKEQNYRYFFNYKRDSFGITKL